MKFDPLFKSENNKLYKLDGTFCPLSDAVTVNTENCNAASSVPECEICFAEVKWTSVGKDEDSYNEAFLADLRDWLKKLEENKKFAVIKPVKEENLSEPQKEAFTASMKHCARRIKDCISVIGFFIPEGISEEAFTGEFAKKHAHYIYFTQTKSADEKIVCPAE